MKAKVDAVEFYRAAYKKFDTVTPIKADCGRLCENACCAVTDEITGMYLFPFEEKMFEPLPDWAELYETDFTYNGGKTCDLITCTGSCERKLRPLSCRIFPLVPYVHRGEKLRIIMDPRGRMMCPLTAMTVSDLDKEFIDAVWHTMKMCMKIKECREFLYALADSIDETEII